MPGAGENYNIHNTHNLDHEHLSPGATQSPALPTPSDSHQPSGDAAFDVYHRTSGEGSALAPPLAEQTSFQPDAVQHSPLPTRLQAPPQFKNDPTLIPDTHSSNMVKYDPSFFEPNETSFLNFDLASMNFGNHYGALEFGILGHLSSGANDSMMQANNHRPSSAGYDAPNISTLGYLDDVNDASKYGVNIGNSLADWQSNPSGQGLQMNSWNTGVSHTDLMFRNHNQSEPHAYSIGAFPTLPATSPESSATDGPPPLERGYGDANLPLSTQQLGLERDYYQQLPQSQQPPPYRDVGPSESIAKKIGSLSATTSSLRKRRRNPSAIYSSVTKPYPYTLGFHALTAVLQRRVSTQKRLAIAQALASIRPSFISCTRTLMHDDLVFMEKCFQRQLLEYEDHVSACGTPTIVCRRTGEVAYAGKEFSLLTGWSKDVLLGKAPNLNVNGDEPISGTMTTSSRTGFNTPRLADNIKADSADFVQTTRPQPVFLAELLDDDSIVQFYEDFAKLAFADSKGSAGSACKLLKYKTKEDPSIKALLDPEVFNSTIDSTDGGVGQMNRPLPNSTGGPSNLHHRMKVDCMYCWTVRRDVFDIPMMIVINVSASANALFGPFILMPFS